MEHNPGTRNAAYRRRDFDLVPTDLLRALFVEHNPPQFFVTLQQAGHYSAVYCNGTFIYDNFGQFSPFQVEVTGYLLFGQNNQIQVYVHKADTTYIRRGV